MKGSGVLKHKLPKYAVYPLPSIRVLVLVLIAGFFFLGDMFGIGGRIPSAEVPRIHKHIHRYIHVSRQPDTETKTMLGNVSRSLEITKHQV